MRDKAVLNYPAKNQIAANSIQAVVQQLTACIL